MTYALSQREKHRYLTDTRYREAKKRRARERYRRMKAERLRKKAA